MCVFVLKLLTFYAIFLMYGPTQGVETSCCPGDKAETGGRAACNQTSSLVRKKDWIMDLNITAFISHVLFVTTAENDDSVQVDIGTTSCDTFDDKACYITCSNLTVDRKSACYVTINVTCNVDNVEGRYVRIRKSNTTEEFALCHAIVAGWPSGGQGLKNFALNGSASQSSTYHFSYPSLAVDGEWGLSPSPNSSCSQTAMLDSNNSRTVHWWQVILTKPILVSSITIVNIWNKCCSDRLANFTVELGSLESNGSITYTLCRYHDGVAGPLTTLNCMRSIWGQSVRISKTGDRLTLCEVEVYGDEDNSTEGVAELISQFNCNNPEPSTQDTTSFSESQTGVVTEDWSTTSTVEQHWDASEEWSSKLEQSTSDVSTRAGDWVVMSTGNQDWSPSQVSTGNQDRTTSQVSPGNQDWTTSQVSPGNQDWTTSSETSIEDSTSPHMTTYSMTHALSPKKSYCACRCNESARKLNTTEVEVRMVQTTRELLVQSSFQGKQSRKKSSASDARLSSATLGITGLTCVLLAFGVIIAGDLYRVCHFFLTRAKWGGRGIQPA